MKPSIGLEQVYGLEHHSEYRLSLVKGRPAVTLAFEVPQYHAAGQAPGRCSRLPPCRSPQKGNDILVDTPTIWRSRP